MHRWLLIPLTLALLLLPSTPTVGLVPLPESHVMKLKIGSTELYQDGLLLYMDVAPFIENSRTWVPIRFVAENLGALVDWDGENQIVTINLEGTEIRLEIGSPTIEVNGNPGEMDVSPFIRFSRTWVPIRFVAENLGCVVSWVTKPQEIVIRRGLFSGPSVAFIREGDLVLKDLTMGAMGVEQVIVRGNVDGPLAWSFDGLSIAYYRVYPLEHDSFAMTVEIVNTVDGTILETIHREMAFGGLKPLSFDPTGEYFLFDEPTADVSGTLWLAPLAPSEADMVGNEGEVIYGHFSAAGYAATLVYNDDGFSITIYRPDGLTINIPNSHGAYAWSSAGDRLAVETDFGIEIYSMEEPELPPSLYPLDGSWGTRLAWSDDDQWLAGNDSEGVYAINLESGELLRVDQAEDVIAVDFLPRWHELLVEHQRETMEEGSGFHLFDLDLGTSTLILEDVQFPSVRPD